jgi:hypothetical protein
VSQFLCILGLAIKSIFRETTLCDKIYNICTEFLNLEKIPQGGDLVPDWLTVLKKAGDNWHLAVNNPCFRRVSEILTMAVTLGVCDPKYINIGKLRVFAAEAMREQVSATSLVDACFKTAIFFVESGYLAWESGSFMPFLFSDNRSMKLENEYMDLMNLYEYAIPGNLEMVGSSTDDFVYRMEMH